MNKNNKNPAESRQQAALRSLPPELQELARSDPQAFAGLCRFAASRAAQKAAGERRDDARSVPRGGSAPDQNGRHSPAQGAGRAEAGSNGRSDSRAAGADFASASPSGSAQSHGANGSSASGASGALAKAAMQEDSASPEERRARELRASVEAVLPRLQALVGEGFERGAFREEVGRYLLDQGVPAQALANISHGWELELATKAMLFDKSARRRAEAEAKLEGLPDVQAPRRAGASDADRLSRARAGLNRNPNSTQALAELFAAM